MRFVPFYKGRKKKMQVFLDFLNTIFNQFWYTISTIGINDIIDIAIVAFLIYKAIEIFRETRAGTLIKGIAIILFIYLISDWFELAVVNWLLVKIASVAIIGVVIIFQPELRRGLERVGRSKFSKIIKGRGYADINSDIMDSIDAVCKASGEMQDSRTGALIVFERDTPLGEIIDTGTLINADASNRLLCNIFYPKSPLHDGAVIIRDGRIYAAACILPLTSSSDISSRLGTRHRAAVGISESSDAVVVVVSEETGIISIACNGKLERNFNTISANERLTELLFTIEEDDNERSFFGKISDKFNSKKEREGKD